jgi:hypothetical protein
MGPAFHCLARLDEDFVSARWHRGHFSFGGGCFLDRGFCQRANTFQNLLGIEAAFACELLPVLARKAVAPAFAGDLLGPTRSFRSRPSPSRGGWEPLARESVTSGSFQLAIVCVDEARCLQCASRY